MTNPNPGNVAALADTAARVVNSYAPAGEDSTGQAMVKLRKALVDELQAQLRHVYPDSRDHNQALKNALQRGKV